MAIKPYQADGLLLLVAISWGVTFSLVQDAVADVPVFTFLFWRFFSAFVLMLLIVRKDLLRLTPQTFFAGGILGLLNLGAYTAQTFGLTLTLSSSVAFITGLFVLIVPLLAYFLFRQQVARSVWIGIGIVLPGLWLLTMRGNITLGWGEVYALVCAVLFALHLLYTDQFARRFDVPLLVTVQFGTMGIGSALLGLAIDHTLSPAPYSPAFVSALVITVLFATVFAFWVQTSMQRFTTPSRAALIFTMEPLSAALFAYGYGGEVLTGWQIFGGGLILAGMIFAEMGTQQGERSG